MVKSPLLFCMALLTLSISTLMAQPAENETQHIEITKVVYIKTELDPDAPLIESARPGTIYEVIGEGRMWYTVKTKKGPEGWVPKASCRLVDTKSTSLLSTPVHTFVFIALLLAAIGGGIFFFINRNHHVEFE